MRRNMFSGDISYAILIQRNFVLNDLSIDMITRFALYV